MGSSGLLQALETHGEHDDKRWPSKGEFWLGKFKRPKSTAIHTYRICWTFEGPGGFFFKFFASSPSKLPFSMKAVSSQGNDWQLPEIWVVHMIHMICVYNFLHILYTFHQFPKTKRSLAGLLHLHPVRGWLSWPAGPNHDLPWDTQLCKSAKLCVCVSVWLFMIDGFCRYRHAQKMMINDVLGSTRVHFVGAHVSKSLYFSRL